MALYFERGPVALYMGDCREVMATMEPERFDSIVTDPPYGLSFMGKGWDHGIPGVEFWSEALRVAKPGAHLVAFGGTRTYHRLACAVEDAGWEIRDCCMWLYGAGFPKSLNVSKAIDDRLGLERPVVGTRPVVPGVAFTQSSPAATGRHTIDVTTAASAASAAWDGWGTALKPAWEPIILARKPLRGTVAANVLKYGTGAINIDACRIGFSSEEDKAAAAAAAAAEQRSRQVAGRSFDGWGMQQQQLSAGEYAAGPGGRGRWPANVLLDEVAAQALDEQSGDVGQRGDLTGDEPSNKTLGIFGKFAGRVPTTARPDAGGASRFFYTSKATAEDRQESCRGLDERQQDESRADSAPGGNNPRNRGARKRGNHHPTVKPTDLMAWLCRLVTPPGGLILDPFMGSGSTGKAARMGLFRFVGVEMEPEYCAIAERRVCGDSLLLEPVSADRS